jgi:hypothetical protein
MFDKWRKIRSKGKYRPLEKGPYCDRTSIESLHARNEYLLNERLDLNAEDELSNGVCACPVAKIADARL